MDYLALPTASTDAGSFDAEGQISSWDAIKELLFDDEAKAFVDIIADILPGSAVPEEDNIGYELEGTNGEVIATIEIAWTDKKLGFMTAEQMEDREQAESLGWTVLSATDAAGIAEYFGGEQ